MEKIYRYNKISVVMKFWPIPAFLGFSLFIVMALSGCQEESKIVVFGYYLPMFCLLILVFVFIANLLSVEVLVGSDGMTYRSMFTKKRIHWLDVDSVKRIYIYSGGFPMNGPPRDLQFILKNGKTMNVLAFIANVHNDELNKDGMLEFEGDVENHVGAIV